MLTYLLDVKAPALPVVLDRDANQLRFEVSASGVDGKALDHAIFQAPLRIMGRPEHETTQAVIRDNATVRVPFPGSYDPLRTNLTLTLPPRLARPGARHSRTAVRLPGTLPRTDALALCSRDGSRHDASRRSASPEDHAKLERVLKSGIARMRTLEGNGLSQDLQPLTAWYPAPALRNSRRIRSAAQQRRLGARRGKQPARARGFLRQS